MQTKNIIYVKSKQRKSSRRSRPENEVIEQAKKDVKAWFDYYSENIVRAREDIYFTFVSQWQKDVEMDRKRKNKSILEFNRLYTHVTQVLGEHRENTPSFKVRAASKDVEQNSVDIREGLLRQISYESRSDIAFQTCLRNQMCGGWGVLGAYVDYEDEDNFDLTVRISQEPDQTVIFFDPMAKEFDKADGRFCGKYTSIRKEDFERRYPNVQVYSDFPYSQNYSHWSGWGDEQHVTIVDYFVKEFYEETIVKLSDGRVLTKKEAEIAIAESQIERDSIINQMGNVIPFGMNPPDVLHEVDRRKAEHYKIMHYKLVENAILEKTQWPADFLPYIYVDGDSSYIEGYQRTKSFVEFAKDAQRMMNFVGSETADAIVNSHRSQWIATSKNINTEQLQEIWRRPDVHQTLIYNPDSSGATPQQIQPFQLSPALFQLQSLYDSDITNILGRYQSNLGAPSNEQSGVAIYNRAMQGNSSTFIYLDNLNRGIESLGRLILSIIPKVYDNTRNVVLRSHDGDQSFVTINNVLPGNFIENEIDDEKYYIEVKSGPNYQIQKTKSLELLLKLAQINPQATPLLMDLIAANIDVENMPQLVERMKMLVPPKVLAKEKGEPMPQQPEKPNPELIIEQMKSQNQQMEQRLKAMELSIKEQQIMADREENYLKSQSAIKSDYLKNQATNTKAMAEIRKAEMNLAADNQKALADILSSPGTGER